MTYSMFIAFVIAVTFLAFNVLVGLTVDDIRKFLGNADLRKLSMRLISNYLIGAGGADLLDHDQGKRSSEPNNHEENDV